MSKVYLNPRGDEDKIRDRFPTPTIPQLLERWRNAKRVLEAMSPHERERHWDMSLWGRPTDCGTVACAAGHCGLDPWFRAQGFQLNFYRYAFYRYADAGKDWAWMTEMSSACHFFGLGCYRIFYNCTPRSVETVIREIDAWILHLEGSEL